ncbi:MAG: tetratricopeptide repeat protein [Candidatus Aminicenantes bacterium]|nr:tetratricopeptide repeat protein [Candidatus Aminicenantes bacterium]
MPISSAKHSIAVLPFVDLSPAKDHEYLCDGIAETLINALSGIKDLHIPARTSAFSFKAKDIDIREIGQKLNVETLLEGSVQVAGDRLRISARLSNVDDGYQLWSESYERGLDDVFAVQDDIALKIVKALKIELLDEKETQIVIRYTEDTEAYQLYLKGRYFWNRRTEDGFKKAIDYLEQAIEKDPSYALAYAGLADCYNMLGNYGYLMPKEAYPKAKEAAKKALEIDDTLAEAHASLAWALMDYDWDWEGAEREFKKAIELNPGYATGHQWYAFYLIRIGRHDDSMAEIRLAKELDPLSLVINRNVGTLLFCVRQYDQAIEALQNTLEMDASFSYTHHYLGRAYLQKFMYEEAMAEFQAEMLLEHSDADQIFCGIIKERMGKKGEVQRMLDDRIKQSEKEYVPPYYIAWLYLVLGKNDQGFKWLDKAVKERDSELFYLKTDPRLDPIRSDPRFKALLKKVGLDK